MHPQSGTIHFLDENITHIQANKLVYKGLSHVPEGRHVFLQMTVQENLEMGAFSQKRISSEDMESVYQHFPRLKERRKQIAGTLSGGEQQMLSYGQSDDEPSQSSHVRRAVNGACADISRSDL